MVSATVTVAVHHLAAYRAGWESPVVSSGYSERQTNRDKCLHGRIDKARPLDRTTCLPSPWLHVD